MSERYIENHYGEIVGHESEIEARLVDAEKMREKLASMGMKVSAIESPVPYEGAKRMLLADNVEDRALLRELIDAMYEELSAPNKRK